jgi:uncharacterized Zn finger protein
MAKEYKVTGSKGDEYIVVNPEDGTDWTCTCPHYTHRKVECKHIKQIKEQNQNTNG